MDLETLDAAGTLDGVVRSSRERVVGGARPALRERRLRHDRRAARLQLARAQRARRPPAELQPRASLPAYAAGVTELRRRRARHRPRPRERARDARRRAGRRGRARPGGLQRALARRHDDRPAALGRLPRGAADRAHPATARSSPDGTHRLEVTVTDGAGNASVQGSDLKVVNHPPVTVTPTPVPTRTPVPTATPTAGAEPGGVDAGQALHGHQARRADGRGELPGAGGVELRGVADAAREAPGPQARGHDREPPRPRSSPAPRRA